MEGIPYNNLYFLIGKYKKREGYPERRVYTAEEVVRIILTQGTAVRRRKK